MIERGRFLLLTIQPIMRLKNKGVKREMTKKEFWKRMSERVVVKHFAKGDYSIRVVKVGNDFEIIENGRPIYKTDNRSVAAQIYSDRVKSHLEDPKVEIYNYLDSPKRDYEGMKQYREKEACELYGVPYYKKK